MANVKNLQIGDNSYVIRDANTYRSLSETQATQIKIDGTYNGEDVKNGEIFTCDDGSFKEFNDDVTYGGDKQLDFSTPYYPENSIFFDNGGSNYGTLAYGRHYGDKATVLIKEDTLTNPSFGSEIECFGADGNKAYAIDLYASLYWETVNGINWGSQISFDPQIYAGVVGYGFAYGLGKYILTRQDVAFSYSDSMNGTWTQGSFPTGVTNARILVFSDEIRLLDTSTGKLYSADLTNGWSWVNTGITSTLPSGGAFTVLNDILYCYTNEYPFDGLVYYSTDKGETWNTTNLPNGRYKLVYVKNSDAFVAVNANNTSKYYTSIDGDSFSEQTPKTGTTIYETLVAGRDCAYTLSDSGCSRIFTGAQHYRSLKKLSGVSLSDIAQTGTGITFNGGIIENFTIEGSGVTVTDKIATGFDYDTYIIATASDEIIQDEDFEIGIKVKCNDFSLGDFLGSNDVDEQMKIPYLKIETRNESGEVTGLFSNSGDYNQSYSTQMHTTDADITEGSWVWIKVTGTYIGPNEYKYGIYVSKTGEFDSSSPHVEATDTGAVLQLSKLCLGAAANWSEMYNLDGSIDLNETYIKINNEIVWTPYSQTKTTISANMMTGATGSVAGTAGIVPAPSATDNTKFLRGDGTWQKTASYDSTTKTITL